MVTTQVPGNLIRDYFIVYTQDMIIKTHPMLPYTPRYPACGLKHGMEFTVDGEPIHIMRMEEEPMVMYVSEEVYRKIQDYTGDVMGFDTLFRNLTERFIWVPKFTTPRFGVEAYLKSQV